MPRALTFPVVPAKAGTQGNRSTAGPWIPACAGMTNFIEEALKR
jgi:hypothetical protein